MNSTYSIILLLLYGFYFGLFCVGVYIVYLVIKALRIYIRKNS